MKKRTYEKAKEFLDNFAVPINYEQLKAKIDNLSKLVCEDYGIKDKFLTCGFVDKDRFGMTASVSDTLISINKLRLEALFALSFDDTQPRKLKRQIDEFMASFAEKKHPSIYEMMLHSFVNEMKEMDGEELVLQSGSYKTVKYEFLDIVFHENRHIVQKSYIPLLKDKTINLKKLNIDDLVLLFTMLHFEMRAELIKAQKIEWEYQDNSTFPIEFDARYVSLVNLNNLRKNFCEDDQLLSKFIIASSLVKPKLKSRAEAENLFAQMESYYSLGGFEKYEQAYKLATQNKSKIIGELESRFEQMKAIVQENKEILKSKRLF